METLIQIIVGIIAVLVVSGAIFFFGVPGFVPFDRKPDKESMIIIGFIFGLIVFVIIMAAIRANIRHGTLDHLTYLSFNQRV